MSPPPRPDPFGEISIAQPDMPPRREPGGQPRPTPSPSLRRQGVPPRAKRPRPLRLFLTLLALGLVVYVALGLFLVPYLIRSVVTKGLASRLDRPVTIGQATFNPFTLRITLVNGIVGPRLSDPTDRVDPILSFSTLSLDLDAVSLPQRAFICRELTLNQPFLHLVHDKENRYNLKSLLAETAPAAGPTPLARIAALVGQRYSINNIVISHGEILYDDLPTAKIHRLEELNLTLPAIANISYQSGGLRPQFSARVNGTPIEMKGQAQVAEGPLTARLNLKMNTLDLAAYRDYLPADLGIRSISGQADLDLDLLYDAGQTEKLRLIGTIALRTAKVDGQHGELSVESAVVKGWLAPFSRHFHAEEVSLSRPIWQRQSDQALPWAMLLAATLVPVADQGTTLPINHLQVSKGEVISPSTSRPDQPTSWQGIEASINTAETAGAPDSSQQAFFALSAHTLDGCRLNLQGSAATAPFAAKGLVVVNKVDTAVVRELWPGMASALPVTSGTIEQAQANFSLGLDPDQRPTVLLEPLAMQAKNLRLEQNGQVLEIPVWQSEQGSVAFAPPALHLGKVHLQQARLVCRRQSSTAAWQTFLSPPAGQAAATSPPVDLSALEITNGSLLVENQGPPDVSLHLERFDLQADQLNPQQSNPVSVATMLDDKYPIQATGTFSLHPFQASLTLQANDLPLASLRPVLDRYFASPMTGTVSVDGTLSLPSLEYHGQWAIASLSLPPLSCHRLSGEGTALRLRPLSLTMERLNLEGPTLHVTANANGMPLLPTIMQPGWQPAASAAAATVAIKAIDVADGALTYDLPGPPGLTVNGQKIVGSITDLTVAQDQAVAFHLTGLLENKGELQAQGTLHPFATQPGLTLASQIKGLPLTSLAPLFEPYWGFTVKAGAMDFDNQLTFADTLIQDSGHLAFTGLTLGPPLAPEAIKAIGTTWQSLPLVQAILQDAAGTLQLTVPIDGRTDTGFTYQEGVRSFLNQLLLKATVSPLNLVSGTRKTLSDTIEFAAGADRLGAVAEEQLNELAALLQDRPLLAVRLAGSADSGTDGPALLRAKSASPSPQAGKGQGPFPIDPLLNLAGQRARAVQQFLNSHGVSAKQLQLIQPELIVGGKTGRPGRRVGIGFSLVE